MSCDKFARDWPLWAAGDLSGHRLTRFQAHLAQCPTCAAQAQAMEATSRQAVEALEAEPADCLDPATWTRLTARALEHSPTRRWTWPALAAAAALVLALVLWLPGRTSREGLDGGVLDGGGPGPDQVPAAPREVALVDAANEADRYEMRLATSDPKVKIVWVFDRNLSI